MSRALAPLLALSAFLAAPAALACGPASPLEFLPLLVIPAAALSGLQLLAALAVRLSLGRRFGRAVRVGTAVVVAPVIALSWLACFALLKELPVLGVGAVALEMGLTLVFVRALSLSWHRAPVVTPDRSGR